MEEEHLNTERVKFLSHFIERLKKEILEMHLEEVNVANTEPLLDLVHGLPGTGRSAVTKWMRRLMEGC